jgi:hypothetical protein
MTLINHQRGFIGLTRHRGLRVVALMALLGNAAQACQVPVFRYALERWEPAPYSLTITPGRGGLSAGEQEIVEHLRHPQTPANSGDRDQTARRKTIAGFAVSAQAQR